MVHKEIEVYMDDMIAKSHIAKDHLVDLRKLFKRLIKYRLILNPNKCVFGANPGKLLGFIVSQMGIEEDPTIDSQFLLHSSLHSTVDRHI